MRTPQTSLTAVLAASLGAALGVVAGGLGGFWVKLRELRARVDGHDDELESFGRRVSRREGAAGRERQVATAGKLQAEVEQLLAASAKGGNAKPHNDRELRALAGLDPDAVWPRGTPKNEGAEE